MKILYLLHFNAPMGGLHENVYDSAVFMKNRNHDVYVLLKEGDFQKRLEERGIKTIITDYKYISLTLKAVESTRINFDIIHTHPGPSRKAALHLSKRYNIPLIITYHGMWTDSLKLYIERVDAIVSVSEGVQDFVRSQVSTDSKKFHVIPNGFDPSIYSDLLTFDETQNNLKIGLFTRLDKDKEFILNIFKIALTHLQTKVDYKITVNIVGSGSLKEEFLEECRDILYSTPHEIQFYGWLTDNELKNAYLDCDIVIAPGRSVIESMASGKPTIAVGSKKYIGLIAYDNWIEGVYNNFGGYGNKFDDYVEGNIEADLDFLLDDKNNINLLGKFSHTIAHNYFNSEKIQEKLLSLYQILILGNTLKIRNEYNE
ncbi:glycosyltransferase family 4 protein [Salinicoccus halodurans]|uniref:Glycosyltransferase involved in cell wall bisynthesis n=1 Tax=Salinicoccus halodurans TaxID=407035 RepID=A0A0F7HJA2_9STAP|nr:glycosyltransferase family 4 protein [Salinicoccus halodurans]AKG73422.1 hypothetical protein AAT16_03825 [Salinicoccus halodurans]SFK80905.1 Glycosyltransferase involved in cell wall bisynthesis [Salinicoccus halodurans]